MLKLVSCLVSVLSLVVGAAITLGIVRAIGTGSAELAFVVGAIFATGAGVMMYYRQGGVSASAAVKFQLGAVLAVTAIVFGVAAQGAVGAFKYPAISIPVGAVGSFIFPFVLFNTLWKPFAQLRDKTSSGDA